MFLVCSWGGADRGALQSTCFVLISAGGATLMLKVKILLSVCVAYAQHMCNMSQANPGLT